MLNNNESIIDQHFLGIQGKTHTFLIWEY